ncbi:HalOD1 output domain-containing protein [Halopiger djelfimassiliensis]|uniref:HalOD1 output domain-containing protein n=1 Tax=Halopiger djelfimassiliensis TaxID=1293047 RepID=UPI00067812F3|nr:HalOD1 output domain-containing protein [Halopiger djelfimassiliensis]
MSGKHPTDRLTPIGDSTGCTVYYDDSRGTYHTWFDESQYEPVSTALLAAVSSVLGVEPMDLEPLSACVDPDALNDIFVHWRGDEPRVGDGSISFTFAQCGVTVHEDGEIVIDPETRESAAPG